MCVFVCVFVIVFVISERQWIVGSWAFRKHMIWYLVWHDNVMIFSEEEVLYEVVADLKTFQSYSLKGQFQF